MKEYMPLIDEPTPCAAGLYFNSAIYNNSLFYLGFICIPLTQAGNGLYITLISNLLAMWRGSF